MALRKDQCAPSVSCASMSVIGLKIGSRGCPEMSYRKETVKKSSFKENYSMEVFKKYLGTCGFIQIMSL